MLIILDGHSIAYRAYHKAPPLSAPDGTPTGAVHIFFTILERVRSQLKPEKIIAVFDSFGETERHKMYPDYKANREAMPEDLVPQIELIRKLLPPAGVDVYAETGVEADDIIATIAQKAADEVTIVTKDKDLFQLVTDKIKIYDDQSGKLLGPEEAREKYGVAPSEMLDYLSLIGDKSDNIPGVAGVGEKTAARLIADYGSLDKIYEHVDAQKGKLKENLLRDKEQAYQAKKLISLIDVNPLPSPASGKDHDHLRAELSRLGMRTVALKLLSEGGEEKESEEVIVPALPPVTMGQVAAPFCFIALEDELYVTDGKAYDIFRPEEHHPAEDSSFYDVKSFSKATEVTYPEARDYLLISWLTQPDTGILKKAKAEPLEEFIPRLLFMREPLEKKLTALKLDKLYRELELPVAHILADMETAGIKLDPARVQTISNLLKQKISIVATRLVSKAGYELNLNSPKQLAEYLYDTLKIPGGKKRSTAEDVLKDLIISNPEHKEVLEDILTYREYSKLLSTYTKPLLDAVADDGRVHTSFKQTGTATGRLSSVNPNLQNIPVRGEIGQTIRSVFIPAEGMKLVSLDYSQIELRILAHMSGDEALKTAFINHEDIHTLTARKILGIEGEVSPDDRRLAKAVNFGIIYGLSPYGLSRDVGITPKEAKIFIDGYYALYSKVRGYISEVIAGTQEKGYCETILGRKRFFPDINSRNAVNRQRAERAAINAPIQGSAADIIKLAMIKCAEKIAEEKLPVKMTLQIHDELIFEVPVGIADEFLIKAKAWMESAVTLSVPLEVNADAGLSWGEI